MCVPRPNPGDDIVSTSRYISSRSLDGWQEKAKDWSTWTAGVFPGAEGRKVGDQLTHVAASSYLNYVVANGVVLLPDYTKHGTPAAVQDRVRKIFKAAFPRRDIAFIDVTHLNWAGGGIHCATCNEPNFG